MSATTSLNFDLFAKDHASSTFSKFGHNVDKSNKSVGALRSGLGLLAKAFVGLYVVQKTTAFVVDSIAQGREANKVSAQTAAVLKSTSHAANINADAVANLANKISLKAGIDDEAIQSSENLLLTFRRVRDEAGKGNDIFTKGTRIITDMSVALGKDLNSSTIMVGKALNDPIAGISALGRAGVQFTTKQKDTIKTLVETGDTLGAQKIILGELNKEFKGSAKAQADPADRARVAWENLQETIGLKLIPVLDKVLIWFVNDALPAIEKFGSYVSKTLGPIISGIGDMFSGSAGKGGELSSAFASVVEAGKKVWAALKPIAVDIYNNIRQNWPQIKATIADVMTAISGVISAAAALITAIWDRFGSFILRNAGRVFKSVAAQIKGAMTIIKGIIQVVTGIIKGDWSQVWEGIKNIVKGAWTGIKAQVVFGIGTVKDIVSHLGPWLWGKFKAAWDKAVSATQAGLAKVAHWVSTLPAKILRAVGNLGMLLYDAGVSVITGLISGITSKIGDLVSTLGNITSMIPLHKGPLDKDKKLLRPAGQAIMDGLIQGFKDKLASLRATMQEITDAVSSSFGTSVFGSGLGDAKTMKQFQRANLNTARQLLGDVKRLVKWGLSDSMITQMVNSGDLAGIHALATSSRGDVRDISRLNAATERALGQVGRVAGAAVTDGMLPKTKRDFQDAVKKGMREALDGAKLTVDGKPAHLHIRATAH